MVDIVQLTEAHLDNVLALISQMRPTLRRDEPWLRRRTLDDDTCAPGLLPLAVDDGRVVGFCFGCLRDGRGVVKLFGVHPHQRRKGVATALFDAVEERMVALGAPDVYVGGVAPYHFEAGVDLASTAAVAILEKRGYSSDRRARVDLEVDLLAADLSTTGAEASLRDLGVEVRRALLAEVPSIAGFARTHFSDGWFHEVLDAALFQPAPLFVALHEGEIVSFAEYDVTGRSRFGPTGTRPDWRERGIGGTLLKLCLKSIRDRGDDVAEIGWVGPIRFYARAVGARIHRTSWTFTKSLTT